MKVSFTGISNVGFVKMKNGEDINEEAYAFSTILKDDIYGNDKKKFFHALEKSDLTDYKSRINPELAGLYINKVFNPDTDENEYYFKLNGTPLDLNKKNLPIFQFFLNLTRVLSHAPVKDFEVDRRYINTDEMRYGLIPECDLKHFFIHNQQGPSYEYIANIIIDPQNAQEGAKIVNNVINDAMINYIA